MDTAAQESTAPAVTDNPAKSRYEMHVNGELAGIAEYRLHGQVISLMHTEVESKFQGAGLATNLARFALDDARARGLEILPFCPYVSSWIKKHPDYTGLVPVDRRADFGLR